MSFPLHIRNINKGIVFHIGRNVPLNFSKQLKLINNYTVTHQRNPNQFII